MQDLKQTKCIIRIVDLAKMIFVYSGYKLTLKDKEFINEIYKTKYDDKGN
jgi:hypothetical protein